MQQRRFGTTDLVASAVGFGTWPIGNTGNYGRSDDDLAIRAIHAALDLGITCFDTAANYGGGHSEELLGRGLGARRTDVVLLTKGGVVYDEAGRTLRRDSGRAHLEWCIDGSLRRLGTDYLDVFLIHWPDTDTPMADMVGVLEDFVRQGKTRYIGVSNFNATQLRECVAATTTAPIAAEQVGYNLFDRRWEREVFGACAELGVGVMAYGPLAHGLLADAYSADTVFEEGDWRRKGSVFGQPLFTPENFPQNLAVVTRLKEYAHAHDWTLPQLALAWVLANPVVSVALVGARTEAEIAAAIGAAARALTENDQRELDEIMTGAAGMTEAVPT